DNLNLLSFDSTFKKTMVNKLFHSKGSTILNIKNIIIDSGMVVFFEVVSTKNAHPSTYVGLLDPIFKNWKQKPFKLTNRLLPLETELLLDSRNRLIWIEPKKDDISVVYWKL
ncbi:MAG: hypothetical protein SNJ77_07280, partial [Cytophagales bacterium]